MSTAPGVPRHGVDDLAQFEARMHALHAQFVPPSELTTYVAYTDGACFGNPDGPGGWAAVVSADGREESWELWGHLTSTSNNRAEALGVLAALSWVPPESKLVIRSDSELTVKILQGAYRAKANAAIWAEIRTAIAKKHIGLLAEWVRGHAGDPGNERADKLSVLGAANGDVDRWQQMLAGASRGKSAPARPTSARASDTPPELAGLEPRGAWEMSFLDSIAKQLRAGRALSEKQTAVLDRIRARGTATPS